MGKNKKSRKRRKNQRIKLLPNQKTKKQEESRSFLTPQECKVLNLIIKGKKHREAADSLHISVRTVDKHVENILKKTNTHSIIEAMKELGLHWKLEQSMAEICLKIGINTYWLFCIESHILNVNDSFILNQVLSIFFVFKQSLLFNN